jgi:hypothetical protein
MTWEAPTPDDRVPDFRLGYHEKERERLFWGARDGDPTPPRGSMADLTARARHAGFPTLADYVDNLEDLAARYEGRRGMEGSVLVDPAGRAHWLPEYEPPSARAEEDR